MVDVPLRHRFARDHGAARRPWHRGWARPLAGVGAALVIVAIVGGLLHMAIDLYRERMTLTGLTDDPRPVVLTIAGDTLSIPANMIRFAGTRRGGAVERADLTLHWPTLEGYSEPLAEAFKDGSPMAPIVFASIAARDSPLDSTARLGDVYARFFTDRPIGGPSGLVGRRLAAESGYSGEVVFFDPVAARPFVARCLEAATPEVPATCLRDVDFGRGLSLLYRFNRVLLPEWRALDTGLRDIAAGFLVAP